MILLPMATTEPQKPARSSQDPAGFPAPPWEALLPGTAAALRPGLAQTADEVIDAIRTAVPAYARPLEGTFGEGIRTGVIRALEQFVGTAEGKAQRPGRGRDIYFELGRGEAREGRPLEALLSAYRVGARVAWRHAAAAPAAAGWARTRSPRSPRRCSPSSTSSRRARPRAMPRAVDGRRRGGQQAARAWCS